MRMIFWTSQPLFDIIRHGTKHDACSERERKSCVKYQDGEKHKECDRFIGRKFKQCRKISVEVKECEK